MVDLFSTDADRARERNAALLRAAGYCQHATQAGYWWAPGFKRTLTEAEAVAEVEAARRPEGGAS